MKVIDGKNAVLGRLASYAAKQALKGEEIAILNCEQIVISGDKQFIRNEFQKKRKMIGTLQVGQKHSKNNDKIVKRVIRGMLPTPKWTRGREAYKKIKCYIGVPKEFEKSEKITFENNLKSKFVQIKEI